MGVAEGGVEEGAGGVEGRGGRDGVSTPVPHELLAVAPGPQVYEPESGEDEMTNTHWGGERAQGHQPFGAGGILSGGGLMNGLVMGLSDELQAELSKFVGRRGRLQGQGRVPGDQQKSPAKGSKEAFNGPKEPYCSKRALLSKAVRVTLPEVRRHMYPPPHRTHVSSSSLPEVRRRYNSRYTFSKVKAP